MILDMIQEWFKELLIDGIISNLTGMFDTLNTKVGEIAGEVGMTPAAWNSSIFNMIRNLSETVIVPIAGIILTFVMCYELIQLIIEKNNLHDFDTWIFFKWIFKTFCAVLIVTNTWNIVMAVFDVAQNVVSQSAGVIISDAGIDISGVVGNLETQLADWSVGALLGLWFQSVFVGLCIMDGLGPSQIARKLTERKILTPAAYYASKGRTTNVTKKGSPYAWDSSTIADIMDRWREYLGHTVNFKTRKKSYKSKKTLHNPESEWKIFDNTHEAIWTEAIADAARLARQTRRRPTKMGEMGMFSGMMFCADCGSIMYQCRATNFRRDQEYYLCSGYRKSRDVCGQTHSIRTVILEELVLQNLREIVSFASQRKDDFVKMVMDADMRQRNQDLAKRQKTLADAEKRIAELDTIFKRLYEDTISGKLSDERFQKLSTDYEKEQHQLQDVAAALRDEIEAEEQKSANVERFLSVVERYTEIPELTPCILHEFVEKIVVHAASDPKGKNRTQEIDIYYKGIGALEVSKVTSSRQE